MLTLEVSVASQFISDLAFALTLHCCDVLQSVCWEVVLFSLEHRTPHHDYVMLCFVFNDAMNVLE